MAYSPAQTLALASLLVSLLLPSGCLTTGMWQSALRNRGTVVRQETYEVSGIWRPGDGRLGIQTTASDDAHCLILSLNRELESFDSVLAASSLTHGLRVFVTKHNRSSSQAVAELEWSGEIATTMRRIGYAPNLSEEWLIDGKPTTDLDRIRDAMGREGNPPDFALMRRIEWRSRALASTASRPHFYAMRGDELWLLLNLECELTKDTLSWKMKAVCRAQLLTATPSNANLQPAPREQSVSVVLRKRPGRAWKIGRAILLTPLALAGDAVLVGFAALVILEGIGS